MQRGRIAIVRPHLHHVADVHDQRVRIRLDQCPGIASIHLQAGLGVLQQDRDRTRVGVVVDAEVAGAAERCLRRGGRVADRVIVEPQKTAVARRERGIEVPLRHLQTSRNGAEHAKAERFTRTIERFDRVFECGQIGGPLRNGTGERSVGLIGTDVENLFPIARVLGQFTVVEAPRVRRGALDRALGVRRQREECAHRRVCRLEQIFGHAVTDDLKETPVAARIADLPQCARIVVETTDVDHRDVHRICHHSLS